MRLSKNLNYLRPIKTNNLFRLGKKLDGGYVVQSKVFKNIDTVLSFGLGSDFSFEKHAFKLNNKLNIIIYDHSVNVFFFFKKLLKSIKRIFYFKSNLDNVVDKFNTFFDYILFFLVNKNGKHIKNKIVKKILFQNESDFKSVFLNLKKNILLKIDIEGDEYQIIRNIRNFYHEIHILIVEFHGLDKNRKSFKNDIFLLKKFFNIIHIHGNNNDTLCNDKLPKVVELTFLNKKIYPLNTKKFRKSFPIKNLDFPNHKYKKDFILKFQ